MNAPHISVIRGQKVLLDFQLAELYGVDTKRLNEQVKRNPKRFPMDCMFELTINELDDLRSQFATANLATIWNHKTRERPYAFTELGIASLSSVLRSDRAIEVNMAILRAFIHMRSYIAMAQPWEHRVTALEDEAQNVRSAFGKVFERLDNIEQSISPLPKRRKRLGLKNS